MKYALLTILDVARAVKNTMQCTIGHRYCIMINLRQTELKNANTQNAHKNETFNHTFVQTNDLAVLKQDRTKQQVLYKTQVKHAYRY